MIIISSNLNISIYILFIIVIKSLGWFITTKYRKTMYLYTYAFYI